MTFEQFKKRICDKDPQVKWALDLIDEEVKEALQQQREEMKRKIPALRQWVNEDRITDASKMVTSEMIEKWLLE